MPSWLTWIQDRTATTYNIGGPDQCAKIRKCNKRYRDMKGKDIPIVTCDDMIT